MARHGNYTVVYFENSNVGLVRFANSDKPHTVRDMALHIKAHGSLEEWLASFVRNGGIGYQLCLESKGV
jgi:hypothetical protein